MKKLRSAIKRKCSVKEFLKELKLSVLSSTEWQEFAFCAIQVEHVELLKLMLQEDKIRPDVVDALGRTILFNAVAGGHPETVRFVMGSRELIPLEYFHWMYFKPCKNGKKESKALTPLELAVVEDRGEMVHLLVETAELNWLNDEFIELYNRVKVLSRVLSRGLFVEQLLDDLVKNEQALGIFWDHRHDSVADLKQVMRKMDWWNSGDRDFSLEVLTEFFSQLCKVCSALEFDWIEWMLLQWKAPVISPLENSGTMGLGPADWVVVCGESLRTIDDIGEIDSLSDYDNFLECYCESEQLRDQELSERYAFMNWDGKSSSDLVNTLTAVENEIKNSCSMYNDVSRWHHYFLQDGVEKKIRILNLLWKTFNSLKPSKSPSVGFLPRLDLVVSTWQLEILKWMISKEIVDLDQSMESYASNVEAESKSEDLCPLCKRSRYDWDFDCENQHFCCMVCLKTCLGKLNSKSKGCPVCETPPNQSSLSVMSRFVQYLLILNSWIFDYVDCRKAQLVDAIILLAAGTNSVLIFEYLIEARKVQIDKLPMKPGKTIMHLVASNGSLLIAKWLCSRGYGLMGCTLDDNEVTPLEICASLDSHDSGCILGLLGEAVFSEGKVMESALAEHLDRKLWFEQLDRPEISAEEFSRIVQALNFSNLMCELPLFRSRFSKFVQQTVIDRDRADLFEILCSAAAKKGWDVYCFNEDDLRHFCLKWSEPKHFKRINKSVVARGFKNLLDSIYLRKQFAFMASSSQDLTNLLSSYETIRSHIPSECGSFCFPWGEFISFVLFNHSKHETRVQIDFFKSILDTHLEKLLPKVQDLIHDCILHHQPRFLELFLNWNGFSMNLNEPFVFKGRKSKTPIHSAVICCMERLECSLHYHSTDSDDVKQSFEVVKTLLMTKKINLNLLANGMPVILSILPANIPNDMLFKFNKFVLSALRLFIEHEMDPHLPGLVEGFLRSRCMSCVKYLALEEFVNIQDIVPNAIVKSLPFDEAIKRTLQLELSQLQESQKIMFQLRM
jgi:hypothetical protein